MRTVLLLLAAVLFLVATLLSIAGSTWNDYAHHTALTGIAQVLFVLSFLPFWGSFKFRKIQVRENPVKIEEQ